MASSIWVPRMSTPVRVRGRRRQSLSMLAAIKTRPTACGVGAHKQYVGPLINIVHSILTANTSHLSCTGNRHEATYDWTVKSIPGRKPVERSTARTTRETYAYPLHPKVVAFHLGDFVQDVQWVGADHPKVTQERYDTLIL